MQYLENGDRHSTVKIILAHGAGAPMDSPFMEFYADRLGAAGLHVIRFEFPYMVQRRATGSKRPPDRQPKLLESWRQAIEEFGPAENLIIGGKSMGGRMATLIADDMRVKGAVCLGYPFYAMGKQDKPRTEHLETLVTPTLVLQGTRDTMGNQDAVSKYQLSGAVTLAWLEDGDHSFKPRKKSGRTEQQNWLEGYEIAANFIHSLM